MDLALPAPSRDGQPDAPKTVNLEDIDPNPTERLLPARPPPAGQLAECAARDCAVAACAAPARLASLAEPESDVEFVSAYVKAYSGAIVQRSDFALTELSLRPDVSTRKAKAKAKRRAAREAPAK